MTINRNYQSLVNTEFMIHFAHSINVCAMLDPTNHHQNVKGQDQGAVGASLQKISQGSQEN